MSEIIKDNIKFSNISDKSAIGFSGLLTNADNVVDRKYDYDPESDPILMALDINWCGAEVDKNTVINTTGELLSWIKENIITSEERKILNDCKNIINILKYTLSDNKDNNLYWYAGAGPVNASSTPGSDSNWHLISGTPASIATGSLSNENRINWVLAVPTSLGLNHISNGALDVTTTFDITTVTCANGVEYIVFRQAEDTKRINYYFTI